MGQLAFITKYPVRDFAVLGSCSAVNLFQLPEKFASAYTLTDLVLTGARTMSLSLVAMRYFTRCSTVFP